MLHTEIHRVQQAQVLAVQPQRFAPATQLEIHVVGAVARMTIGIPYYPAVPGDERQRGYGKLGRAGQRRVVGEIKSAKIHGLGIQVVKLEPIIAVRRFCQPLVEAQAGGSAQGRGDGVGRAGSRAGEQPPIPTGEADGLIADLEPILHVVHNLAGAVEQIGAAAVAVQRLTRIEVRLEIGRGFARAVTPEDQVTAGGQGCSSREHPLARLQLVHTQTHPGQVERHSPRIVEFQPVRVLAPGIDHGRVVARHEFVQPRPRGRYDEIGRARAGAAGEAHDSGAAIGQATLRNPIQLRPIGNTVDLSPKRVVEHDGSAFGRQFEVQVIRPRQFISRQLHVAAGREERNRRDLEQLIAGAQVKPLQRHRQS